MQSKGRTWQVRLAHPYFPSNSQFGEKLMTIQDKANQGWDGCNGLTQIFRRLNQ